MNPGEPRPAFFAPILGDGEGTTTAKLIRPSGDSTSGVPVRLLVAPPPRRSVRHLRFEGVEGSL